MPGESPSQPGWYPDHNGTMRWFDGASWTDHVQPGSGAAGSEPTLVQSGSPSPTQPLPQQPGWGGGQPPAGPPSGPPAGPPQGPPGAAPGSPYGAVPQPSFPGGPGQGGPGGPGGFPPPPSGGGNKGLLIILAVVGAIVLIAILAVGSWAVFLRDSDDDSDSGGDNGGDNSSLPDTAPEEVVEAFFEAAKAGDCEAALDLVSQDFIAEEDANCDDEEDFMDAGEFEYEIGETTIDEDAGTAKVPVTLTVEGFGEEDVPIELVIEDDEWKIDSFEESTTPSASVPTDPPTDQLPTDLSEFPTDLSDFPTDFTDFPSDFPTDFPTDPSELESYLETYFSDFLTPTG